jgi:hypothetical protein
VAVIDNLVAYWSLEEASGTRDDAHAANDLTDNNTVTSGTGKVATAASFTAANSESLTRADTDALSMGDIDFSFAFWVNLSTTLTQGIVSKWNGSNLEYDLRLQGGTGFRFYISSADAFVNLTNVDATDFGVPSTATWYFVVARHDATANTIDIGVNGGTQTSAAYAAGGYNSTSTFALGVDADGYLDGLLDEVGIWKKKLSAPEIAWLYNAGAGRSYADIVAEATPAASSMGYLRPNKLRPRIFAPGLGR